MRLQATRELVKGETEKAETLANEADEIGGIQGGERLRASLAAHRGDLELALEFLGQTTNPENARLRARIWLARADPGRAVDALNGLTDAEDEAVRAHALYMLGRTEEAFGALERAERSGEDLVNVRRAGIALRYAAALSPELTQVPESWPEPTPLGLVRADREATRWLERACEIAKAALREPNLHSEFREEFETWQLACLANQRECSAEAEDYAITLLQHGPPHRGAIVWSLARGYALNYRREIQRIERLLRGGYGELTHLTVMLALALNQGKPQRARRALADFGSHFEGHDLLDRWRVIVAAELGENPPADLPLTVALQQSQAAASWGEVSALVQRALDQGEIQVAYQGIECLASNGQWSYVVAFIPALLDQFRTSESVTIACLAAYNTHDFERTVQITDGYANVFPDGHIPLTIRRARLVSLQRTGDLPAAYHEADTLASGGELPDLLSAIDTRLLTGDVAGAVPLIRVVAGHGDLPPETALRYARVAKRVDPVVAGDLWTRASASDLSGHLAELATTAAFELGLDDKAAPAVRALVANADSPHSSVRMVTIEEMAEFIRARREHLEEVESQYQQGNIPIHVASDRLQVSLADWFSRAFAGYGTPLLVLHGSRASRPVAPISISERRLRLDLTGLLTGFHLGLLDFIERDWSPVELPYSLPQSLLEMEEQLRPHQPSVLTAAESLIASIDSGLVGECDIETKIGSTGSGALEHGLLVIDFLGNVNDGSGANSRRVLDALAELQAESPERLEEARDSLGSLATEDPAGKALVPGQKVVFARNTIVQFVRAGLLKALTGTFSVFVDSDYVRTARDEMSEARRKETVADEIGRLRDRISRGIRGRTYRLLPQPSGAEMGDSDQDGDPLGPATRCLFELLKTPAEHPTVSWIDDRMITQFQEAADTRVVGALDILASLVEADTLSEGAYFSRLMHLREAGAQFLPVTSDEILYHLRAAPLHDGEVNETRGLRGVRRSIARLGASENSLKLNASEERRTERNDEMALMQMLWRQPRETITRLWSDEELGPNSARAGSSWIYENLVADQLARVPMGRDESASRRLYATGLAGLIVDGLQLAEYSDPVSPRRSYFEWLEAAVLDPCLAADQTLACEVASIVTGVLKGVLGEGRENANTSAAPSEREVAAALAVYIQSIPAPIRNPITDDLELLDELPVRVGSSVDLEEGQVSADAFFDAAANAIKVGHAVVSTSDGHMVRLERSERDLIAIRVVGSSSWTLNDPALGVLAEDEQDRYKTLEENVEWIDRPLPDRERIVQEIVDLQEPHARMFRLDDERRASAAFQYGTTARTLAGHGNVGVECFASIDADMACRHLRLEGATPGTVATWLEAAAEQLIRDVGVEEALNRLVGLPIELPKSITEFVAHLNAPERGRLLQDLGRLHASPIRQMRAVEWGRIFHDDGALLKDCTGHLFADLESRVALFHEVLLWVDRRFEQEESWRDMPQEVRLVTAWAHAERLTDLTLRSGASPVVAAKAFSQWSPRQLGAWLLRDPSDDSDPCSAAATSSKSLVYTVIGTALGRNANDLLEPGYRDRLVHQISEVMDDGTRWPDITVLSKLPRSSCLNAILNRDFPELREVIGDDALAFRLAPEFADALATEAMESLTIDSADLDAWTKVLMVRQDGPKPDEKDRLGPILKGLDTDTLMCQNEGLALAALAWMSRSFEIMSDGALRCSLGAHLVTVSRGLGKNGGGRSEAATMVGDAVLCIARNAGTPQAAADTIGDLVSRIVQEHPGAAGLWRKVLPRIARQLPVETSRCLWPVIFGMRAKE
ncbi:MAG: HEAT repeat domain-containing protein [Halofilum sp. (in: g-proteobacteria)]